VAINEDFEVIISILGVFEEIIEAAAVDISKTFIGTLVEDLPVQVADSITALEMSHHNMLLLNNYTRNRQGLTMAPLSTMVRLRMKRMAKTYSDRLKSCKLRIRKLPRRRMRSRCHLQADHPPPGHKASRTRQSSASPSRDHLRLLPLLQNPRYLKS
jgi:hypothetical protein